MSYPRFHSLKLQADLPKINVSMRQKAEQAGRKKTEKSHTSNALFHGT